MVDEPLIAWPQVAAEWLEFAAAFLVTGAAGFLAIVLPLARRRDAGIAGLEGAMQRSAAIWGLLGALASAWHFAGAASAQAARRGIGVVELLGSQPAMALWAGCVVAALAGFLLVVLGIRAGIVVASLGAFVLPLRPLVAGRPLALLKSFHVLAGGMWLGLLFVIVVAALAVVFSRRTPAERRGPAAAALVNAFSPFALGMGVVMAVLGIVMTARELQPLTRLWTSFYGRALMAKLAVVALVYGVGAWNAFRLRPRLGSGSSALTLRRTATVELVLGALALLATAILVGMPEPGGP